MGGIPTSPKPSQIPQPGAGMAASGFNPQTAFNGQLQPVNQYELPPTQQVQQGINRAFAPIGEGGGPVDRLAGLWQAGVSGLGVPEQAATQALTGGAYTSPGQALQGAGLLPQNELGSMMGGAANIIADPLVIGPELINPYNLMMNPSSVVRNLGQGAEDLRNGTTIVDRVAPTSQIVLDGRRTAPEMFSDGRPLLYVRRQDADAASALAGVGLPSKQHPELKSWYHDFTNIADPDLERTKIQAALYNRDNVVEYDKNLGQVKQYTDPSQPMPSDWTPVKSDWAKMMQQPWDMTAPDLAKEKNVFAKFLGTVGFSNLSPVAQDLGDTYAQYAGTPSNYSPLLKNQAQTFDATNKLFYDHKQNWSDFVVDNTKDFDFWQGSKSDLNRALIYNLKGDTDALADDLPAQVAYNQSKNSVDTASAILRNNIYDQLGRVDPSVLKTNGVDLQGLRDSQTLDKGAWDYLVGTDTTNPTRAFGLMQRQIGFDSYIKPTADAVMDAVNNHADNGFISPREQAYSQMFTRAFLGNPPTTFDKELQSVILNNKGAIDALNMNGIMNSVGDGMQKLGMGGDLSQFLQRGLTTNAEEGTRFSSSFVSGMRDITYKSLMGYNIGSAVKNIVSGTLNNLAEYGMDALQQAYPAAKAAFNPDWAKAHNLDNVLSSTNSYMSEFFQKTPFIGEDGKPLLQSLQDHAMDPMHITENFNRGLSYMAALKQNIDSGGMTVEAAIQDALDKTKQLHFGYSNLDMSPYLTNPLARMFMQFNTYPMRHGELMYRWMQEGGGIENKLVKYLAYTGAVMNIGARHGIDMGNILGIGLGTSPFPPYMRYQADGVLPNFTLTTPVYELAKSALTNSRNLLDALSTGIGGAPTLNQGYTNKNALSDLGDLVRIAMPGGTYAMKALKQGLEESQVNFPSDTQQQNWVTSELASFTGAKFDPSIGTADRLTSMLGFRPSNQEDRADQRTFVHNYLEKLHEATAELNQAVINGQDYSALQEKWQDRMANEFGPGFTRAIGSGASQLIREGVRPSPMSYLKKAIANTPVMTPEMRQLQAIPVKSIKQQLFSSP